MKQKLAQPPFPSHPFSRRSLILLILGLILSAACQEQPDPSPTIAATTPATAVPTTIPQPTDSPTAEPTIAPTAEAAAETISETAVSATTDLPLIDDFELSQLPTGQDGSTAVGYFTWSDGSPVSVQPLQVAADDALARPEQTAVNTILQLDTAVGSGGWAGFSHALSNEALNSWQSQDWSLYEGISLWLHGNNTGGTVLFDILDNRNPDPSGDDAERWTYDIIDDFSGWQYFEISFDDFRRKDIGNGAPNDGFTLTAVHGYAIGTFGSVDMGAQTYYIDDVQLYGVAPIRPPAIEFVKDTYMLRENGRTTILLNLTKPSDETVTVDYSTAFGTATAGEDYEPLGGTLTFPPGETVQSIPFTAIDDEHVEELERILLVLSNPVNAELAFLNRTTIAIRDNETPDPSLIANFDTPPPFITTGAVSLTTPFVNMDDALALPEQSAANGMLQVDFNGATTFGPTFAAAQDWSKHAGLSFWFYGQNSGQTVTLELLNNSTTTTADLPATDWQLIWSDEFNHPAGTSPNPAIWQPEIGDGTLNGIPGWGNNELETYTDDPANVATDGEGNLVITAHAIANETDHPGCYYGPCEYTSARLITWHRLEVEYGRIEARMRLPYGQGIWPAFWLLGTDLDEVGWPQSGEIDIMENIGREPATVHGTVHGPGYSGGNGIGQGYDLPTGTFADDFHTFAIEWTPEGIGWFMDDENYFTLAPDQIPAGTEWVYDHPFFIIFNLAVGGNWPGYPNETTTFPQTMLVDYVRVYGAPSSAERFETTFVDDFEGWQLIERPFTSFIRSSNQPANAPDDGLTLTNIWGYQFTTATDSSGTLYIDQLRFE